MKRKRSFIRDPRSAVLDVKHQDEVIFGEILNVKTN